MGNDVYEEPVLLKPLAQGTGERAVVFDQENPDRTPDAGATTVLGSAAIDLGAAGTSRRKERFHQLPALSVPK